MSQVRDVCALNKVGSLPAQEPAMRTAAQNASEQEPERKSTEVETSHDSNTGNVLRASNGVSENTAVVGSDEGHAGSGSMKHSIRELGKQMCGAWVMGSGEIKDNVEISKPEESGLAADSLCRPITDAELLMRVASIKKASGCRATRRAPRAADEQKSLGNGEHLTIPCRAWSFSHVEGALPHGQLAEVSFTTDYAHTHCSIYAAPVCITCKHRTKETMLALLQVEMETVSLRAPVTLREKVAVAIRCRPTEAPESTQLAWQLKPSLGQISVHPDVASLPSMQRFAAELDSRKENRCQGSTAQFDMVFDSSASTRQVYKGAAQRVVLSALDGINGAIMAYGQTGSGKTYTMLGDHMSVGIITMALMDIFTQAHSRSPETKINITATFVELYSERLRDLFAESMGCASDKPITIRVGSGSCRVYSDHISCACSWQRSNTSSFVLPTCLN
jgi:hypothetical protein